MAGSEPWQPLEDVGSVSDAYKAAYRQLRDAEYRLDDLRKQRRLTDDQLDARSEQIPDGSLRVFSGELVSLAKVVEALGGHVEVRAVFDDETITLLREPPPPAAD